jgi:lysophospholipase L1-like esterase
VNWETLLCLGDSITFGARSYCAYPDYAGAALEKTLRNHWQVVTYAVNGYTAMDLQRYITENFSNIKQYDAGVVSLLIGTNDVKKNTDINDFEIAYRQILLKIKLLAPSKRIFIIKIPHLPAGLAYPYTFEMNDTVTAFNNLLEKLAHEYQARLIEFELREEDLFDGIHLTAQGSYHVGQQLAAFILEDKGKKL